MQNKSQTSGKHVYKYGNVLLKIFINIILKRDPCIFFFFFYNPPGKTIPILSVPQKQSILINDSSTDLSMRDSLCHGDITDSKFDLWL